MNFLNPDEQTRIKIKKQSDEPKPAAPVAGAPGAKPAVPGAKPGLAPKPGVPGAKPGLPGAKPAPAPTAVSAVVKPKSPPRVQVNQVEDGIFEVHFTCSCGEQYLIRCDSAVKNADKDAEKSAGPQTPQ